MTHWLSVHQPRRLSQNKDKYHVRLTFGVPVAVYWPWATLQEFVSLHTGRISTHIGSEFLFCACHVHRSVGAPPLSTEVFVVLLSTSRRLLGEFLKLGYSFISLSSSPNHDSTTTIIFDDKLSKRLIIGLKQTTVTLKLINSSHTIPNTRL
jgi:hypothetical protein